MAENTPWTRASELAAATTPRPPVPPTTTGWPRRAGRRSSSTDTKNASMSTWRIVLVPAGAMGLVEQGEDGGGRVAAGEVVAEGAGGPRLGPGPGGVDPGQQRLAHPAAAAGQPVLARAGGHPGGVDDDAVGVVDAEVAPVFAGHVDLDARLPPHVGGVDVHLVHRAVPAQHLDAGLLRHL